MRVLVLLLGISTTALAIACGYLYQQLQHERARVVVVDANIRARSPELDGPSSAFARDSNDASTAEVELRDAPVMPIRGRREQMEEETALGSNAQDSDALRSQRLAQRMAEFQQRMADPATRARMLAQFKSMVREQHPDVAGVLRLTPTEETALFDLLAAQQLQRQEANGSRRFATDAERQALQQNLTVLASQHEQEQAELLGPARYEEYRAYERQVPERQQIRELRSRLDETNSLNASQSSRLIDAMYQERDSYLQQVKSAENFGGYSTSYPITAFPKDRDPASRLRFAEQQVARTEDFMGRLRLRASSVLNAEQLRRFDEIQDEQLTMVKAQVERVRNQANRPPRRQRPGQ
jgi:hypothetical protein